MTDFPYYLLLSFSSFSPSSLPSGTHPVSTRHQLTMTLLQWSFASPPPNFLCAHNPAIHSVHSNKYRHEGIRYCNISLFLFFCDRILIGDSSFQTSVSSAIFSFFFEKIRLQNLDLLHGFFLPFLLLWDIGGMRPAVVSTRFFLVQFPSLLFLFRKWKTFCRTKQWSFEVSHHRQIY